VWLCDVSVGVVSKDVRMGECGVSIILSVVDSRRLWVELGRGGLGDVDSGRDGEVANQICRVDVNFCWEK